jgi:lipoyl(octanoyl) transferase
VTLNHNINREVKYRNLGLIDYKEAWDYQESLFSGIVDAKLANRNKSNHDQVKTNNYLLFCQHPHVYTLGKSGDISNLLLNEEGLKEKNATFYHINRGGDITYHGPGQLVGYPILDLDNFFTDIHRYLRLLEEAIILTCRDFGLDAGRIDGLTGVWLDYENKINPRKICAIGVKSSRWITMHGFAFNINTNLDYFNYIIPCGINDKAVTSLSREIGTGLEFDVAEERVLNHLVDLFEMELIE